MAGALASDEPKKFGASLESDQAQHFYEACVVRCDANRILSSIVRDIRPQARVEWMPMSSAARNRAHLSPRRDAGQATVGRYGSRAETNRCRRSLINAICCDAIVVARARGWAVGEGRR